MNELYEEDEPLRAGGERFTRVQLYIRIIEDPGKPAKCDYQGIGHHFEESSSDFPKRLMMSGCPDEDRHAHDNADSDGPVNPKV